jgi:hypothetical protein
MPGSGVRSNNIKALIEFTGAEGSSFVGKKNCSVTNAIHSKINE